MNITNGIVPKLMISHNTTPIAQTSLLNVKTDETMLSGDIQRTGGSVNSRGETGPVPTNMANPKSAILIVKSAPTRQFLAASSPCTILRELR